MTIFEEVLVEEYNRAIEHITFYENELLKLPKGSIQRKQINGKNYYYLQWRENNIIKSKYIKNEDVEEIKRNIERRNSCKEGIKVEKKIVIQVKKALGKEFKNELLTKSFL